MDRQTRQRFGKSGQAVKATKILVKEFPFSDPKVKAQSWMLINEKAETVTFANTYDGDAGRDFDAAASTHPLSYLNGQRQKKRLKQYHEVPVSECPIAEAVEAAETVTA